MPFPLPTGTSFHITKRSLNSGYVMPTLEASADYYEIGYILSGDRLTITPGCSFILSAGSVGTMPPFLYHRTMPLSDAPYNSYLVKFLPEFVRPLTDAFGHNILEEIYSHLYNRFPPSMDSRILLYFRKILLRIPDQNPDPPRAASAAQHKKIRYGDRPGNRLSPYRKSK